MKRLHRIPGGLQLGIGGAPDQVIGASKPVHSVAVYGADYPGVRPEVLVAEGDSVQPGTPLFRDRKRPALRITARAHGTVSRINIGARRHLASIIVSLADSGKEAVAFDPLDSPTRETMGAFLQRTGLWASLRTRPFGRIPDPGTTPDAIFVTALHSDPLAPHAEILLAVSQDSFSAGLGALKTLTDGPVFVCQAPGPDLATPDAQIRVARFSGTHPAGLPGTHIDRLHPIGRAASGHVWQIDAQDVIAMGHTLTTGHLPSERMIALAGPGVTHPRLMRVPPGAALDDLVAGDLKPGQKRVLSGSPLSGVEATHLHAQHWQVSVLDRPAHRTPRHSWLPQRARALRPAPLVPTAALDRALGPRLPVVALLRALSSGDAETAERLGARALIEEDMALVSYAAGGELDYGRLLRDVLDQIEAAL